jgi:transposase
MPSYSPELKEQMVRKMMPPANQSVASISRDTGISAPTLYAWKKQFRDRGFVVPSKSTQPDHWDSKAKLAALIHTSLMNEVERKRPPTAPSLGANNPLHYVPHKTEAKGVRDIIC